MLWKPALEFAGILWKELKTSMIGTCHTMAARFADHIVSRFVGNCFKLLGWLLVYAFASRGICSANSIPDPILGNSGGAQAYALCHGMAGFCLEDTSPAAAAGGVDLDVTSGSNHYAMDALGAATYDRIWGYGNMNISWDYSSYSPVAPWGFVVSFGGSSGMLWYNSPLPPGYFLPAIVGLEIQMDGTSGIESWSGAHPTLSPVAKAYIYGPGKDGRTIDYSCQLNANGSCWAIGEFWLGSTTSVFNAVFEGGGTISLNANNVTTGFTKASIDYSHTFKVIGITAQFEGGGPIDLSSFTTDTGYVLTPTGYALANAPEPSAASLAFVGFTSLLWLANKQLLPSKRSQPQ